MKLPRHNQFAYFGPALIPITSSDTAQSVFKKYSDSFPMRLISSEEDLKDAQKVISYAKKFD